MELSFLCGLQKGAVMPLISAHLFVFKRMQPIQETQSSTSEDDVEVLALMRKAQELRMEFARIRNRLRALRFRERTSRAMAELPEQWNINDLFGVLDTLDIHPDDGIDAVTLREGKPIVLR